MEEFYEKINMRNENFMINICTNVNIDVSTTIDININLNTINYNDFIEYKFNKCKSNKHIDFITINEFNIVDIQNTNNKIGFTECLLNLQISGKKYTSMRVTIQQALSIIQLFNKNKSMLEIIFDNLMITTKIKNNNDNFLEITNYSVIDI